MEVIRGVSNLRSRHRGCIVTIGNFDGVHKGHQAILKRVKEKSQELGLPSVLICFEPQPREFFDVYNAPARLTRFREKIALLDEHGIDIVLCFKFDEKTKSASAQDFIDNLVDDLDAKLVLVGDDFQFGRDREGDFSTLQRAGEEYGFEVANLRTLAYQEVRVSSTRIRECLAQGNFELAEELLGHRYSIMGKVIYGRQLGRELGAPTANIQLHRYRAPIDGVYAVEMEGLDEVYQGVANVGVRPTIDEETLKPILEVHLFDFDQDIYGRGVKVNFCHKIRPEKRFDNLELLKEAIHKDMAEARQYFARQ